MTMLHITTAPTADGLMGVCVAGEIDMETAPQVTDAVRAAVAAGPREVQVDMAAVTFLDSSGIHMLLRARREAAECGVALRVVKAHRSVVRVLQITGLLSLFQDGTLPN